ncbi:GNAT family N-acetyltransferase [Acinetobacter sp. 3657]|uniref:GNAT family N-acetyltransferase n=1 Tax=Acinetobacter sp. 3657 TaxID=2817764 RepID=UPI0028599D4E|nr:ribosomal protein S18 acetylase RimI-like enzyme [Prolinoborus sp. 3657]
MPEIEMSLNIRKVKNDDLEQLVVLINIAYRTQSSRSWTTEKDFICGQRITQQQLSQALEQSRFELFVAENELGHIIACIGLTFDKTRVEIGTFAIDPTVQNLGYGREMLHFVEEYVEEYYHAVASLMMYVLDVRSELIAYYQRRGYQMTGRKESYPLEAGVGQPLVPTQLIEMRKLISRNISVKS